MYLLAPEIIGSIVYLLRDTTYGKVVMLIDLKSCQTYHGRVGDLIYLIYPSILVIIVHYLTCDRRTKYITPVLKI